MESSVDYQLRPDSESNAWRLKAMLPAVLRFIFARGHAKMRSKIMVVRHRDKQTSEQPLKKGIMRRLNELLLYGTYCMVLTVRYFRYGTVRYCISLSHYLYPPPPLPSPPPPSPSPFMYWCCGRRRTRWTNTKRLQCGGARPNKMRIRCGRASSPAGSIAKPCEGSSRAT